jgi:hypothetical protein
MEFLWGVIVGMVLATAWAWLLIYIAYQRPRHR